MAVGVAVFYTEVRFASPLGKTRFQAGFSTEHIGGLSVGCTLGGDSWLTVPSFHQRSALNHAFCKSGKNQMHKTRPGSASEPLPLPGRLTSVALLC